MQYNQPYGVSDPNAPYINGNPSTGTMGSIPPAASIEYPQREIVNLIADAGLATPDNADLHQLSKSVQSMLLISDDDAGTANAYQVTMTPAPGAYFKYMTVICKIGNTNTGASVLNVNAMGPKPIRHPADNSELAAGELIINSIACFIFDGTIFHLVWTSGSTIGSTGTGGGGGGGTIYLTKPVDFYVNANTGNDNYDGLTAAFSTGIHGPFLTLQKAASVINRYNLNGFNVNVHVADGNYGAFTLPSPSGTGSVIWTGNTANPGNCLIYTDNYTAVAGGQIGNQTMQGFKTRSSGNWTVHGDPLCCIYISGNNSTLTISAFEFNGSPGAMVSVGRSAQLTFSGNSTFTISGSSTGNPSWTGGFLYAFMGGNIQTPTTNPPTVQITAAISLTQFILASINAMAQMFVTSFPGAGNVTGSKYGASLNGVVNSSGSGANYYPGSTAGTLTSGGQYA
jgi:hypothetical protein